MGPAPFRPSDRKRPVAVIAGTARKAARGSIQFVEQDRDLVLKIAKEACEASPLARLLYCSSSPPNGGSRLLNLRFKGETERALPHLSCRLSARSLTVGVRFSTEGLAIAAKDFVSFRLALLTDRVAAKSPAPSSASRTSPGPNARY